MLRKWHRLLKPGDSVAFTSTHEDSYFGDLLQEAVRTVLGPNAPLQMHGLLGTEEKIRHQLTSADFSDVQVFSETRGGYKPADAVQCTRGFLSVFFKGVASVVDLRDERLGQVCGTLNTLGRDAFVVSVCGQGDDLRLVLCKMILDPYFT